MILNFNPILFNIYKNLSIEIYGLFLLIGIIIYLFFILNDKQLKTICTEKQLINSFYLSLLLFFIGAKLLYYFSHLKNYKSILSILNFWEGGLSILGGAFLFLIFIPIYLIYQKIAVLNFLDRVCLYFPILEAIARLGCLFSGCCFGALTKNNFFYIKYVNSNSTAPLFLHLYPLQIYISISFFILFIFLYNFSKYFKKPGQLFLIYIINFSIIRFITDFYRYERVLVNNFFIKKYSIIKNFSLNQIYVIIIVLISLIFFILFSNRNKRLRTNYEFI